MVEFDSTILPGREGRLVQEVSLKNMKGIVRKSVTVFSNAANTPELQLFVEATIEEIIEVSSRHIRITEQSQEITLATGKKDLAVFSVEFKPKRAAGAPDWQGEIPFQLGFTLTTVDSSGTARSYYRLKVVAPESAMNAGYGEFIVTTNHPEKQTLTFHGNIYIKE